MASLLVLGGTSFAGRHVVAAALERGVDVTIFNRGLTNPGLFPDCEHRIGDRSTGDLASLAEGEWDGVVDVNGYNATEVRTTAELLRDRVGHYTFVSFVGAYVLPIPDPIDESSPIHAPSDGSSTDLADYGPQKVRCEQLVQETFPGRASVMRPGLIVGPHDYTERFTYFVRRAAQGGTMLMPDRPDQPEQFIHARDQGHFLVDSVLSSIPGTFNTVGPDEPCTLADLLATIASVAGVDLEVEWVDEEFVAIHGAQFPIPTYWPSTAGGDGLNLVSNNRALAAGLKNRTTDETIADILEWDRDRDQTAALDDGIWMDAALEAELLAVWGDRNAN